MSTASGSYGRNTSPENNRASVAAVKYAQRRHLVTGRPFTLVSSRSCVPSQRFEYARGESLAERLVLAAMTAREGEIEAAELLDELALSAERTCVAAHPEVPAV